VIVQIEHAKAVDRLPEILQVVGIGAVMIGVNDLAASMGLLRDALSNDLVDTIERIAMTCRSQSMPFGLTASMRNVVLSRTGFSPDFLILGEDLVLMQAGFQNAISDVLGHEARC
jgi:2-keto-3-deoxy-L-rhamnonate aldolase RhmA